jgi:hypothetical protein
LVEGETTSKMVEVVTSLPSIQRGMGPKRVPVMAEWEPLVFMVGSGGVRVEVIGQNFAKVREQRVSEFSPGVIYLGTYLGVSEMLYNRGGIGVHRGWGY